MANLGKTSDYTFVLGIWGFLGLCFSLYNKYAYSLQIFMAWLYRVSHSEMNDSKWLWGVEGLWIFLNYGG